MYVYIKYEPLLMLYQRVDTAYLCTCKIAARLLPCNMAPTTPLTRRTRPRHHIPATAVTLCLARTPFSASAMAHGPRCRLHAHLLVSPLNSGCKNDLEFKRDS